VKEALGFHSSYGNPKVGTDTWQETSKHPSSNNLHSHMFHHLILRKPKYRVHTDILPKKMKCGLYKIGHLAISWNSYLI